MATSSQKTKTSSQTPSPASQKVNTKYEQLSLGLLNINGLRNKTHEVKHIIARDKLHVVALCETKLNSKVKESKVHIPGFSMWRKDRNDKSNRAAGGVALYIQDHIKTRLRPDLMTAEDDQDGPEDEEENPEDDEDDPEADEDDSEANKKNPKADIIWVEIDLPKAGVTDQENRRVLLGCCYISVKNTFFYLKHIKKTITLLSETDKDKEIFLMGDFNIDWLSNSEKKEAEDFISEQGWTQIVKVATRLTLDSATCIDHIYTNAKGRDSLKPVSIPTGCSDHNLITVKIDGKIPESKGKFRPKQFDKEKFKKEMNDIKWEEICKLTIGNKSLQEALNKFTEKFLQVANEHAKPNTKNIYMLLKLVGLEYPLCKRDRKKEEVINMIFEFIETKKQAQIEINNYLKGKKEEGENDATKNTKKTSRKSNNKSQGAAAKEGEDTKKTNPENPDLKSGLKGFLVEQKKKKKNQESIFEIIKIEAMKKWLKYICGHVVKVIDETEAALWELAADSISAPLRDILNEYIKNGEFPNELKKIKSFPFSTDNYNDIRQKSGADRVHIILSYIFDVILYVEAKPFFIGDALNSEETFKKKLEQIETDRCKLVKTNRVVEAVLLDFTSYFDKISYNLLIRKLKESVFSESDLKLIKSFLSIHEGSSGLPGGSCLTQLVHIIIINDLKETLEPSAVICNNYMMIYGNKSKLDKKMETVRTKAEQFNIEIRRKQFEPSELSAMFKILDSMIRCHGNESNWIRAPGNIVKQNGDWEYDNVSKELELHFGKEYIVKPEIINNSAQESQTQNKKHPAGSAADAGGSGGSSLSQRNVKSKTKK